MSTSAAAAAAATTPGLNDREVEEIMRFINGVEGDSVVATSTTGGSAKHKTKQKCRKVGSLLPTAT